MKQGDQSRLDTINSAYLKEEPPVQHMTLAGLEAWQNAQPKGACVCPCIGSIDHTQCKARCFFALNISCSTGHVVHADAALSILEEKMNDSRLHNYVVIKLNALRDSNPSIEANPRFQALAAAVFG